jgi:hypothetical protein
MKTSFIGKWKHVDSDKVVDISAGPISDSAFVKINDEEPVLVYLSQGSRPDLLHIQDKSSPLKGAEFIEICQGGKHITLNWYSPEVKEEKYIKIN